MLHLLQRLSQLPSLPAYISEILNRLHFLVPTPTHCINCWQNSPKHARPGGSSLVARAPALSQTHHSVRLQWNSQKFSYTCSEIWVIVLYNGLKIKSKGE